MFQTIITFLIIALVVFIAIKRLINQVKNPSTGCSGCEQSCHGCALDDLKKDIVAKNSVGK